MKKQLFIILLTFSLFFIDAVAGAVSYSAKNDKVFVGFVLGIQQKIMTYPEDYWLKKKLVQICYDRKKNIIHSAGRGKHPSNTQLAKRAALLDAYRWAAYINTWKTDSTIPFGKIASKMPGGKVVFENDTGDGEYVVLLEISSLR